MVLSACQTGLGKPARGETVLSLASAFMAAGARGTVTTLWSVDDAATRDIMAAFYWAAMTLHGADEAMEFEQTKPVWWWALGGVSLLGFFFARTPVQGKNPEQ